MAVLYHGTCVLLDGGAVLISGPSGAGKSDLALRLIYDGGRLVGDDYVQLTATAGRLYATAPKTIRGKMEVRGVGLIETPSVSNAEVRCLISLVSRDMVERLPENSAEVVAGVSLPAFKFYPFEASASAKVAAILALCNNQGLESHRQHHDRQEKK